MHDNIFIYIHMYSIYTDLLISFFFRTVKNEEINKIQEQVRESIEEKLNVTLR
jgi:phenylalanyl-tRNA synthetase beta subunit